jgi:hypothetical protein
LLPGRDGTVREHMLSERSGMPFPRGLRLFPRPNAVHGADAMLLVRFELQRKLPVLVRL